MSRYQSHLNSAVAIIEKYDGSIPLAAYLKNYFSQHKKYGSKDRKQIGALCYNYFRLGHTAKNISIEERILTGVFLCEQSHNDLLEYKKTELNNIIELSFKDKLIFLKGTVSQKGIFPFNEHLSEGIDEDQFSNSFLIQPDLFLRIRPGFEKVVLQKAGAANLPYHLIGTHCLAIPNATKIADVFEIDKEVVIQDMNSQKVLGYLPANDFEKPTVWDCCAASGGKSLLLYDQFKGGVKLTVSDIRKSILQNLHSRFSVAGIKKYDSFIQDISDENFKCNLPLQDIIVCDAPCSGSGTWSRTPEHLYYFDSKLIADYSKRQKKIVQNIIPYLKSGGLLVYITCSVFREENEEVVDFVRENFSLSHIKSILLKGYDTKADSMFVAYFKK